MPEVDHAGSSRVYVQRTSASQRNAATTMSHHDSRTRRPKRGDSVVAGVAAGTTAAADRRKITASYRFKNRYLGRRLHAIHYTPDCLGRRSRGPHGWAMVGVPGGAPTSSKL